MKGNWQGNEQRVDHGPPVSRKDSGQTSPLRRAPATPCFGAKQGPARKNRGLQGDDTPPAVARPEEIAGIGPPKSW